MTLKTNSGAPLDAVLLYNYLRNLVNLFFKILPIRESEDPSLSVYMRSLQLELLGCGALIDSLDSDPTFVSLLAILQFLIDHPETPVADVRREVFRAISICNKLSVRFEKKYG